ncbi:MAG: retroviral-like aspartic protease family protein [Bacteroidetes bacterium]|nr:retroviral-like aspartic protease family protein [Bacteroidota bacterium]MBU1578113.1 retroviral-like aspartic protease family protein [Bacteroidota bacterium]MBU2466837.1 retroviral-like aspartic protease family protein [Bacteroidota bacterium]MBU2557760.1 retroviral-like aspartic protease family protein [Bacteroidota bacterium]
MHIVELPFQLISIEGDGYHIMVNGKINGLDARFLVDTGASRTVFDIEGIKKFVPEPEFLENEKLSTGLGTNEMPSMVVEIDKLSFGEAFIEYYTAIAIDLKHVHFSYQNLGLPPIDGVLGGDLLVRFRSVINYKTRKIKFYD